MNFINKMIVLHYSMHALILLHPSNIPSRCNPSDVDQIYTLPSRMYLPKTSYFRILLELGFLLIAAVVPAASDVVADVRLLLHAYYVPIRTAWCLSAQAAGNLADKMFRIVVRIQIIYPIALLFHHFGRCIT